MSAASAELGKKRLEKARASWAEEEQLSEEQAARLERARAKEKEMYGAK
jgi:hypothetical protein